MTKKILISLLISIVSNFACAKTEDKILAKVDGKEIHESELKETITSYAMMSAPSDDQAFNYDNLSKEIKDEIVKSIVLGDLILKEAKVAKTTETKEYKAAVQFAEKQLTQKFYIDKILKENISETKMKERYKEIVAQQANKEEYKASHILVKTEEEAKDVKKKLDKGVDFKTLAKELSLDGNKDDGGSLGYFSAGQMVPEFEKATADLKIGQISNPVKTDFGYHIIKLDDKRKVEVASFEKMRSKIYDSMASQFIQDYFLKLQKQNKVEFF
jgi:parvulin-like peptidyl-prolyl isomerase